MKKISITLILTVLALVLCCACFGAMAEEPVVPEPTPSPTPTLAPLETPAPDRLAGLQFLIEGPDERMPMTVTYADLTEGKLVLEGLATGTYTVTEISPEELLEDFTFVPEKSVTTLTFTVTAGENAVASLLNVYSTATPTVTPTLEPTPTPTPEPPEFVDVPVVKVWGDNNNADGNRPVSITVYLHANGTVIANAVLSEATGWEHTFTELPALDDAGAEIVYTISEQPVPMYETVINGYTITNNYVPETTQISVEKIWNDDNNKLGFRPKSLYMHLSNGMVIILNEGNGWKATVTDLPTILNGEPVVYTWIEQESLGYEMESCVVSGTTTTFTNKLRERSKDPGEKSPPKRGNPTIIIDEYGTPLGVNVTINHVGDCFE